MTFIAIFVLTACSKDIKINPEGENVLDTAEVESGLREKEETTAVEEQNQESNVATDNVTDGKQEQIAYPYVQELNIIEDNYRNYYEIFVYSFYDSDGDGIGDINGVIEKLDYINDGDPTTDSDLGFNGIWLMPIMPSTTYHKYDVTDYYNIDPQYGTLEDFKTLLQECDKRGIKLIIDLVFNHTSSQHPWFKEAVAYLQGLENGEQPDIDECPYVEYYHFTKDYEGGSGYHRVGNTQWYYEGMFWDQMPDLNLGNPKVREEIEMIAKFWLDLGVGGFRLDAVKEFYSGQKDKNIEVLKWFTDYVASLDKEAYIVGEAWDSKDAIASYYESGIPSLFNFPLAMYNGEITKTARRLGPATASTYGKNVMLMLAKYQENNPNFIDSPFISNHDTTRISAQCVNNEEQMKMSAGLLLTMNGSPFVYYGEEIGMNSSGDKDENKRLPMQWSLTDQTGMTRKPSNADLVEQKFPPVDEQMEDPLSLLNYYKRAIRIRNENPEIARGEVSIIEELTNEDILAIRKVYEESEIAIIYNIHTEGANISLEDTDLDGYSIRGYLSVDGSEVSLENGNLYMPKYSIVILK
ncbi:MAG: alpha amylase [Clostridiales bacterium]|nr:alpha amylase [Clostridiales bacterium]